MKVFVNDPFDLSKINPTVDLDGIQPEHAIGFFTCTPDLNYRGLAASLTRSYPLPVVGGTILGNPFDSGQEPFISRFSVLGKKNLRRHVALSDPLDPHGSHRQMRDVFRECRDRLDNDVKLYLVMAPVQQDLYTDHFFPELMENAGDVPVIGGMLSDEMHSLHSSIFARGKEYSDRILVVAMGGDIRPAFATGCEITIPSDYEPVVTSSRGNIIETVDGMRFIDYLYRVGLDESCIADFPVAVHTRASRDSAVNSGEPLKILALTGIDGPKGAGIVNSQIPVGTRIGVGYLTVDNILSSTRECLARLSADMRRQAGDGYRYEILFGISCLARYYTVFNNDSNEADCINEHFPDIHARFGFYGLGEFCPFRRADGTVVNGKFGKTLGLCAL